MKMGDFLESQKHSIYSFAHLPTILRYFTSILLKVSLIQCTNYMHHGTKEQRRGVGDDE